MEHVPVFTGFNSTYVISSSHQHELVIPYQLGLILHLSPAVITVYFLMQFCKTRSTGVEAMCFHLDVKHKSKKNMLGVTYKSQPVSCHCSAQCARGEGDKSLNHFVSEADTNSVAFHVTDAAHTGLC